MTGFRCAAVVLAFVLCSGFSSDSAGRACVQQKGERGVGYDVNRTKVKDAYTPNGRRMLQDGHRVYEIEVPPLIKRDKAVYCTMSLASGMWETPGPGAYQRTPFASNPFSTQEPRDDPFTAPGTRERGSR